MDARGRTMPEVVFTQGRLRRVSYSLWRLRLRLRRGVELVNGPGLNRGGRGRKKKKKKKERERVRERGERMLALRLDLDRLGGLSDSSVRGINGRRGRVVVRRVAVLMLMLAVPVRCVLRLLAMKGHHPPPPLMI